jgi:hypothetical protein
VVKAADIHDDQVVVAVHAARHQSKRPVAFLRELQSELGQYPPKVVLAKVRSMQRRGLIHGCSCGCRGDYFLAGEDP